jgi:hypothetical protein
MRERTNAPKRQLGSVIFMRDSNPTNALPEVRHSSELIRVVFWEAEFGVISLKSHLSQTGHPFVTFQDDILADSFTIVEKGQFVELFTVPIDLRQMLKELRHLEMCGTLDFWFDIIDLPLILIRRNHRSPEAVDSFCGVNVVLNMLPTWLPQDWEAELTTTV